MPDAEMLSVLLWVVQVLLGLCFALGSVLPKLLMPMEALLLAELFVRLIDVAEVLGRLALVLSGWLPFRPGLTL
jgi:hypothetical protein